VGYVFARSGCALPWQAACQRLQIGGEQGYGWGDLALITCCGLTSENLFDGQAHYHGDGERPVIKLHDNQRLLAHTQATAQLPIMGEVEPLVGREWRSNNAHNRHAGQHVAYTGLCFAPGSTLKQPHDFALDQFGIWR
jgi:hypothetical protein